MDPFDPASILRLVHAEIEEAVATILTEAEAGLGLIAQTPRLRDDDAGRALSESLNAIVRACMFQDITGQRLVIAADRLARTQGAASPEADACDPLLNGPARPGAGVDQAEVDRLLSEDAFPAALSASR